LESADLVNAASKAALGAKLADKLETQKVNNQAEEEERKELKNLEEQDLVNPESKATMADLLAEKIQTQAVNNKQEAEEAAELKALGAEDLVNPESKAAMANMLADKMEKQAEATKEAEKAPEVNDQEEAVEQTKQEEAAQAEQTKEEEAEQTKKEEAVQAEEEVQAAEKSFKIGDEIFLIHLFADTDLNEQDGVIVDMPNEVGKYLVQLHSSGEKVRVMAKNLSLQKNKDGPKQKALQHMMVAGIGSDSEVKVMNRKFTAPEAPPDPDATPALSSNIVG